MHEGAIDISKADNLLALLWLLRSRGSMTAAQLAEALEVNVRTVYRYIDGLCAGGVPIVADSGPGGGYRLPPRFRGAPLFFDPGELVALFQSALLATEAGIPDPVSLERALAKIRLNLAPDQEAHLERHIASVRVASSRREAAAEPWLGELESAVADHATVELLYRKPDSPAPEARVVDPYRLVYRAGRWYVVGYCHLRESFRDFRVDRVQQLVRTGETFEPVEEPSLNERCSEDWIMEQLRTGNLTPVRIAGSPSALTAVCEHWYMKHCCVERSRGEALFRVDPAGMAYLPAYFLSFGTALKVLEPERLRSEIAELALSWAQHHQEDH